MQRKTKWILGSTIGLVLIGAGGVAFANRKEETIFTAERATRQDLRDKIEANGQIQALKRVQVGSQVTAEIKQIHVKDGQQVSAGDLLVTLDQEKSKQDVNNAQLGLKMSQQDLQNAEAAFQKQSLTFSRQETLFKQGLLSSEDHQTAKLNRDNADTTLQKARVAVHQADAYLAIAQDALSKTIIRASMSGTVTGLKAEKGEMAIAGMTNLSGAVLMVISDLSEMLAEINVGELEVVKLKVGQPAEIQVDAIPGKVFQGKVLEVASAVDASSQQNQQNQNYRVRVRIAGSSEELKGLRPGMSARVAALCSEAKNALTVPLQAIQERESKTGALKLMSGSKSVVFVVKDGKVEERELKVGTITRKAVEVLDGVKEGESVVTGPAKALPSLAVGAKVKTQSEADAIKNR
jgi:HlyD family secretion protein